MAREDVFTILDDEFNDPIEYWNSVYQERPDYMSFLNGLPDENLVSYLNHNQLNPRKVLELGCGEGRNTIYMSKQGREVEVIDFSNEAISKGRENSREQNVAVEFSCKNVFELELQSDSYDMVYDSGLMHHITYF